ARAVNHKFRSVCVTEPIVLALKQTKHTQHRAAAFVGVVGYISGFDIRGSQVIEPCGKCIERDGNIAPCYGGGGNTGNCSTCDNSESVDRATVRHELRLRGIRFLSL